MCAVNVIPPLCCMFQYVFIFSIITSKYKLFFTEKEERKKVVNAHVDHGTTLSERIKKRKRSLANHKPEDVTDDSASYEGSRGRLCVS